MRADRLLSILLLLQSDGHLTARALAARLEVTERTILRDMDALSAAGVPVIADRGRNGGWRLVDGYRTEVSGLSMGEVAALAVPAVSPRLLADLGLAADVRTAWAKLLATLPEARRRQAELVRERLYVDPTTWRQTGEAIPLFPVLQDAVWQQRCLAMTYEKADGAVSERVVEPLGLVAKGSTWYLVAAWEGNLRTFRASRIRQAEVCRETFARPVDFDLVRFWHGAKADFVANLPAYRFCGRVSPILLPRLAWSGRSARIERTEAADPDGWSRVVVRVQTFDEAVEYGLGLGTQFRVTGPDELVAAVRQAAADVASFYGR